MEGNIIIVTSFPYTSHVYDIPNTYTKIIVRITVVEGDTHDICPIKSHWNTI